MLIYSEKRYLPAEINMMTLRCLDGFLYIHRSFYDQIVVIYDIYSEAKETLIEHLTGKTDSRADVDWFWDNMPTPVNAMGPFLLLVQKELDSFVDMIGALHVMSMPMNLRKMLQVPFEMRNTPSFSLTIKEEYQLSWENFFMLSTLYDSIDRFGASRQQQTSTAPAQQSQTEQNSPTSPNDNTQPADDDWLDRTDDAAWSPDQNDTSGPNGGPSLQLGVYIPDGENQIRKIGNRWYNLQNEVFDDKDTAIYNGIDWMLAADNAIAADNAAKEKGEPVQDSLFPTSAPAPEPAPALAQPVSEPVVEQTVTVEEPADDEPKSGIDLLMSGGI